MNRASRRMLAAGVALGATLLGGCRSPLPELAPSEPQPGAHVDFVRNVMIEAAKVSEGPARSEKAVEAVRVWRGKEDTEE